MKQSDLESWRGLGEHQFAAKLDLWLYQESEKWLRSDRDLAMQKPDPNLKLEFQELLQLMALGFSGLYYYLGLVLNALSTEPEKQYTQDEVTTVCLGGNGSRFLHWLSAGGQYRPESAEINALLSKILNRGAKLNSVVEQDTRLSKNAKHEVAYGLVAEKSSETVCKCCLSSFRLPRSAVVR